MVNAGYTYQGQNIFEFGVKRTSMPKYDSAGTQEVFSYLGYVYMLAGGEAVYDVKTQLAPKLGAGVNFLILNVNLNVVGYNDHFKTFYPAIVPEIGISLLGILQIDYGRNIFLEESDSLGSNRISLRINYFINSQFRKKHRDIISAFE